MRRRPLSLAVPLVVAASLVLAACGGGSGDSASDEAATDTTPAGATIDPAECAKGKTLKADVLTVATGNPAYSPWVVDDKPESKEGFEAAVAYAVAAQLGLGDDQVEWVRTNFDEAIQPGAKNFDFNLQQFTITEERKANVSFSDPYYSTNQAIVGLADSKAKGVTSVADLKGLKFGAQAGTTSLEYITKVIQPTAEPFAYDDNAGAKAALEAGQVDAIVFDLPTALYVSGVEIEGSSVLGQFPLTDQVAADNFGLVFDLDNPLVECVNAALANMKSDGSLDELTLKYLSTDAEIPVIQVG
ncbi:MAG: amino acid ABC transporter substrate-binding protein [Actinobacteria bacterium]|nr:amino acid ABC transporter substrate-binding protein [Actinomycetota bacterium]